MKIGFENWYEKLNLTQSIVNLFKESVICYKAGAYKASLLYSYLGFMAILKQRILGSKTPPGIPEGKWNQIILGLQDKEKWDKQVFESTQMKRPSYIFPISDTLRREIMYWKDRRNDCAHFKHELIDSHHVDSLWSFIQRNLPKLTINGGKDSLLEKFRKHFDISFTPENTPFDHLIREIEFSVDEDELVSFYEELVKCLPSDFLSKEWHPEVFGKIVIEYDNHVSEKLLEFLKKRKYYLFSFLRTYPHYIKNFHFTEKHIRKIWFDLLFEKYENDFPIYTTMIQEGMIPKKDMDEAHRKIINRMQNFNLTEYQSEILDKSGFFDFFHEHDVYAGGYFDYKKGNRYSSVICKFIERKGFSEKLVSSICNNFESNAKTPFQLETRIQALVKSKPELKKEFVEIAEKIDAEIPPRLSYMVEE